MVLGAQRVFCCHRARLSGTHPPNSLAAVRECVEAGAPRLELDVRFLADDSMLVAHDRALAGIAGAPEPVHRLDRAAVLELFSGFPPADAPCFLEDVVDVMRPGETLLQVDLKLMRPITPFRAEQLARILAPMSSKVLVGSQAHWNLRDLAASDIPVAFDPTLHWHYFPGRTGEGLSPSRLGLHGLWDDATIAHVPGIAADRYIEARMMDLLGLVPRVREWMVDSRTLLHLGSLGVHLGDALADRGIALAAWTLRDEGREASTAALRALFDIGATTIITDQPLGLAGYASGLEIVAPVEPGVATQAF